MQELKIKLLNNNAKIPTRGSEKAAGWDLYAAIEAPITIKAFDEDDRGEVIVALHNDTRNDWVIEPGERIAQLVVEPYIRVKLIETSELDDTARGEGGFGSTGTK